MAVKFNNLATALVESEFSACLVASVYKSLYFKYHISDVRT